MFSSRCPRRPIYAGLLDDPYNQRCRVISGLSCARLAYRYRYAMSQLGISAYAPTTNRMEATLKPEITAAERVEAMALLDRAFRDVPTHPSCDEYRDQ